MQVPPMAVLSALVVAASVAAQTAPAPPKPPPGVVFENVRAFDGTSDRLSAPSNVLVVAI